MPHDQIRSALAELVRLKDIKERIEAGKASNIERGEYSFHKEAAWENARAALRAQPAAGTPQAIYGPGRELIGFDQSAAVTVSGDEREAFEAAYAAHLNRQSIHAKLGAANYTPEEIASMREGDSYDESTPYLNGCWAGWKFARAALAAPAAPQEQPSDAALTQALKDRDDAEDMADQLAAQIAAITGEEIGEHTSANDPWRNAMLAADDFIAEQIRKLCSAPAKQPAPQAGEDAAGQVEHLDVENHRLRRAMRKIMARLTDLLDEDQFGNIESIVKEAGVEPPELAGEDAQPVGEAGTMPGTSGFTMACFKASDVPVGSLGTKLYATLRPAGRDAREIPDEP